MGCYISKERLRVRIQELEDTLLDLSEEASRMRQELEAYKRVYQIRIIDDACVEADITIDLSTLARTL